MTRPRRIALSIAAAAVAACCALTVLAGAANAEVKLTRIDRFHDPVQTVAAPGPSAKGLLFVVERPGVIKVVKGGGTVQEPFLDLTGVVKSTDLEQGLLSLAFDPRYERNGRFYVYYTAGNSSITIARYVRDPDDPLRADPDSAETLLSIPHPASLNHNGGTLAFGPDRDLWISTGDGHPVCDPPENAQNTDSLLGKILRIDPVGHGYAIPPDNPFVGGPGADEVYAYGLRNPFRFSIDPRNGGTIAIGDVGQYHWEEVDFLSLEAARGANFGWDAYEGVVPLNLEGPCASDLPTPPPAGAVFPVTTYPHAADSPEEFSGCAVIGGVIVRDPRLTAAMRGRYIFSDHCRGKLRSFIPQVDPPAAVDEHYVGVRVDYPTAITTGRRNRIYVTSRFGAVFRIDPAHGWPRPGAGHAATG